MYHNNAEMKAVSGNKEVGGDTAVAALFLPTAAAVGDDDHGYVPGIDTATLLTTGPNDVEMKDELSTFIKNFHKNLRQEFLRKVHCIEKFSTGISTDEVCDRDQSILHHSSRHQDGNEISNANGGSSSFREENLPAMKKLFKKNMLDYDAISRQLDDDAAKETSETSSAESTNYELAAQVWNKHKKQHSLLKEYAKAMQSLATEYWQKHHSETRIDWCIRFLRNYFYNDGLLKLLNKDKRILLFHLGGIPDNCRCCGIVYNSDSKLRSHQSECVQRLTELSQYKQIYPPSTKVKMLDVGSCYAPFMAYGDVQCLSIDLCPANTNVYQCDFLEVELSSHDSEHVDLACEISAIEPDKVVLIYKQAFDVVVFSLLLEYMPSPYQRWRCCVKAQQVLKINGLLLIITPDSNRQHRRAKQIADWKIALESIGLRRCCYKKLEHIHCMAFRNVGANNHLNSIPANTDLSHLMYIPQDSNTRVDEEFVECDNNK